MWWLILIVGVLVADDSLATVTDWLGREQPIARKALELTTSGGGGAVTAPVTASAQQRAQAVQSMMRETPPTPGGQTARDILAGISAGRSAAGLASRLVRPGATSATIDPAIQAAAASEAAPQAGGSLVTQPLTSQQPFQIPSDVLSGAGGGSVPAPASPASQVSGGEVSVGTEVGDVGPNVGDIAGSAGGAAGTVLPILGAAISISQDAMSNQSNTIKAVDAAIDTAGAVLSILTPTYGLPSLAASFVKEDINRTIPDIQNGNWARAVIADSFFNPITLVSDLVQLFGGPDLTKGVLGGTPKGSPYQRKVENAVQFANQDLSNLAHGYRGVTDLPSALQALQSQQGGVGAQLRLPPEIASWLGASDFTTMNHDQFRRLLTYFAQDPSRIDSAITSTGQVPKLPGEMATQVQQNAGEMAKGFLHSLVSAMPPAPTPEPPTAPPLNVSGPSRALGFAQDLLPQEA